MTRKTILSLAILLPVFLGAVFVMPISVRASSAGPDTIVVSPANVAPGVGVTTSFTQDVVIAYSHNVALAYPKVFTLQYAITYDSAVIDVDQSICATSTDFNTYCGVTAGSYAQSFAIQQLPQNNPCGPNFCASIQPISGTMKQIFVASIATFTPSGGVASAGGTHATIYWKVVSSNGKTGINFSALDTFYSTSSTSAIDPSTSQIFYTATSGSFDNSTPPTPSADLNVQVAVLPQTFVFTLTTITIKSIVTNNGNLPGSGTFTLTYGSTVLINNVATGSIPAGGQVFYTTTYNVGSTTGTFAVTATVSAVGFTDPTPTDNAQTVTVNVRLAPTFTVTFVTVDTGILNATSGFIIPTHKLSLSTSHTLFLDAGFNFTGRPFVYIQYSIRGPSGAIPTVRTGVFREPNFNDCPVATLANPTSDCQIEIQIDMSTAPFGVGIYHFTARVFYSDRDIGPFLPALNIEGSQFINFVVKVTA